MADRSVVVDEVTDALDTIRAIFERAGEINPPMALIRNGVERVIVAMPGLNDRERRVAIQTQATKADFVVDVSEVWCIQSQPDDPAHARHLANAAVGRLDTDPDRREQVRAFVECLGAPIRHFAAEITRDSDGEPTLGPWIETPLSLPRPGFKRYLPEHGKARSSNG